MKCLQAYDIETFATKVGVAKIAKGAFVFLLLNYVGAIATGAFSPSGTFHRIPMIGGHLAFAAMLVYRFRQLDANSVPSIKKYYKHIWDLFYLEYGLYTVI
jgi:homogentisate solanesyltransferase